MYDFALKTLMINLQGTAIPSTANNDYEKVVLANEFSLSALHIPMMHSEVLVLDLNWMQIYPKSAGKTQVFYSELCIPANIL